MLYPCNLWLSPGILCRLEFHESSLLYCKLAPVTVELEGTSTVVCLQLAVYFTLVEEEVDGLRRVNLASLRWFKVYLLRVNTVPAIHQLA